MGIRLTNCSKRSYLQGPLGHVTLEVGGVCIEVIFPHLLGISKSMLRPPSRNPRKPPSPRGPLLKRGYLLSTNVPIPLYKCGKITPNKIGFFSRLRPRFWDEPPVFGDIWCRFCMGTGYSISVFPMHSAPSARQYTQLHSLSLFPLFENAM